MMSTRPGHTRLCGQATRGTPAAVIAALDKRVVALLNMIDAPQRLRRAGMGVEGTTASHAAAVWGIGRNKLMSTVRDLGVSLTN